jgi:hypothetical protein
VSVSFHLHYFLAPAEHFLPKELSQFFSRIPGGGMQQPSNAHYSRYYVRIATKLGVKDWGKCQLSFALLFSSIQALSAKMSTSNFRSNSRRGTRNYVLTDCTTVSSLLILHQDGFVSLLLAFHLHYFLALSEHFCQKNYLTISLQFRRGACNF